MYSYLRFVTVTLVISLFSEQYAAADDRIWAPDSQDQSVVPFVAQTKAYQSSSSPLERFVRKPSFTNGFKNGTSGVLADGALLAGRQVKAANESEPVSANEPLPATSLPLSKTALEVSQDLGIVPLLERLEQLKKKFLRVQGDTAHIDLLSVRQDLIECMLNVFLETRDVAANIDADIARADAVADYMEGRRDKGIRMNNIANFLIPQGGMAIMSSSTQIGTPNALQNFGNEFEAIAASMTVLLSAYALHQAHGPKQSEEIHPNMLASILGREPVDYNKYPPSIWAFLNKRRPGENQTRRQVLINGWIKLGRIKPLGQAGSAQELDQLCGTIPLRKAVTIDLLRTRIPMLEDVRATLSSLSRDLREITGFIRRP